MTTQEKLIRRKLSLLELAEFLKNVSQALQDPRLLPPAFLRDQEVL